jgi:hypothetical protein
MPLRRHQYGSALGEQAIFYALVALCVVGFASVFSQSVFWGFVILGVSLAGGLLLPAYGYFRMKREGRLRVERCRAKLEKAAAGQGAALDAVFLGEGEGAMTGFGVAGTAGKLVYAHNGYRQPDLAVFDFDELTAAFARPDGGNRYRIEVRVRSRDGRAPRAAMFLRVEGRAEADRWVQVLKPHLGERVKFVASADELRSRDEG